MPVSNELKTIFVHIPKTAGKSVEEALGIPFPGDLPHQKPYYAGPLTEGEQKERGLEHHVWWRHLFARELRQTIPEGMFREYFKFAFVRNPWDRVLSHYMRHVRGNPHFAHNGSFEEWILSDTFMNAKARWVEEFTPQMNYLADPNGECLVDFVGKYENLKNDWAKVCHKIGITRRLPHINRSRHRHYSYYYNDQTRQRIEEAFKDDIQRWGYKFENYSLKFLAKDVFIYGNEWVRQIFVQRVLPITLSVAIFLALDLSAAQIYQAVNGHTYGERRSVILKKQAKINSGHRTKSPIYHHDLKPNIYANNASYGSVTYRIRTNSLGFRDSEVRNIPLSSDRRRVVFMGDSFTEGLGVDYPQTFVGLIDEALSREGIEVLNAAVTSYSPIIYWRKFKYLIEKAGLKFDEAVVFLDISDAHDETLIYELNPDGNVVRAPKPKREPVTPDISGFRKFTRWIMSWLGDHFVVVYGTADLVHDITVRDEAVRNGAKWHARVGWTIDAEFYDEYGKEGLRRMSHYMDKLADLFHRSGIKMTVAIYPWPNQIWYKDLDSIQQSYWKEWCESRKVDLIDYFPLFIEEGDASQGQDVVNKYFIPNDMHWNVRGHRLIAKIFLAKFHEQRSNARNPV